MIYISVKFLTNDIDKFFFSKFDDITESYLVINNLINVVVESAMIAQLIWVMKEYGVKRI